MNNNDNKELLHVGLDVGSTTVKIIVMDKNLNTIYKNYQGTFQILKYCL